MDIFSEELTIPINQIVRIPSEGEEWLLKRSHSPNAKSVYQIKQRAEEFGVTPEAALVMRERYLRSEAALWDSYTDGVVSQIGPPPYATMSAIEKELEDIERARKPVIVKQDEVTPQMIEQAREVKVDSLVEFVRGKMHCFNHEDKTPSAFHGTRENRVVCPVCNDSWDSIAVTMRLGGLSFHDAVRQLCR